jgi:hypothetical protein
MNQPQQQQIPLSTAFQITERVLIGMKQWLENKKELGEGPGGYEFDSHKDRTALAIRSVHHARILLPSYMRHLILESQTGLKK